MTGPPRRNRYREREGARALACRIVRNVTQRCPLVRAWSSRSLPRAGTGPARRRPREADRRAPMGDARAMASRTPAVTRSWRLAEAAGVRSLTPAAVADVRAVATRRSAGGSARTTRRRACGPSRCPGARGPRARTVAASSTRAPPIPLPCSSVSRPRIGVAQAEARALQRPPRRRPARRDRRLVRRADAVGRATVERHRDAGRPVPPLPPAPPAPPAPPRPPPAPLPPVRARAAARAVLPPVCGSGTLSTVTDRFARVAELPAASSRRTWSV